jgi:hypothetical protein
VRTENIIGYYVSEDPDVPAVSDPRWKTLRAVKSFSRDIEYTMSEGIGKKVLYVWFKDSDGNVSDVQSDTIRRIDSKYLIVVFVLLQLFILL